MWACLDCIYLPICQVRKGRCSDFYPVEETEEQDLVEIGRKEFYADWYQYVSEYDTDIFF